MRGTPETDARTYIPLIGASTVPAEFARKLERELNSARAKFVAAIDGRDMANEEADKLREQNAKLISIAERAIDDLRWFYESKADGIVLELDQLKGEAK